MVLSSLILNFKHGPTMCTNTSFSFSLIVLGSGGLHKGYISCQKKMFEV